MIVDRWGSPRPGPPYKKSPMQRMFLIFGFVLAVVPPARGGTRPRRSTAVRPGRPAVPRGELPGLPRPRSPRGTSTWRATGPAESVAEDLDQWEAVLEQVRSGAMPPAKAKRHPTDAERARSSTGSPAVRRREAARNAGDPGPVPARRLSNAEYDDTIRDLTGVDIRPTREFPVDPANEAGFDNSAESLAMSPALVKKYLEAARKVADHLVLKPDGFAFASHPVVADTDRDKYCVRRIIDFYKRQRTDLADYFLAAWRFATARPWAGPAATLADFAAEAGISPTYLATIWSVLTDRPEEVGPIAALQALWRELARPRGRRPRRRPGRVRADAGLRRRAPPPARPGGQEPDAPGGSTTGSQTLVLWKNRQFVANRMRYAGGASKVRPDGPGAGLRGRDRALAVPDDPADFARFEATFARFCSTFPDAFFVSERARVYLDPKEEKGNAGRLLERRVPQHDRVFPRRRPALAN